LSSFLKNCPISALSGRETEALQGGRAERSRGGSTYNVRCTIYNVRWGRFAGLAGKQRIILVCQSPNWQKHSVREWVFVVKTEEKSKREIHKELWRMKALKGRYLFMYQDNGRCKPQYRPISRPHASTTSGSSATSANSEISGSPKLNEVRLWGELADQYHVPTPPLLQAAPLPLPIRRLADQYHVTTPPRHHVTTLNRIWLTNRCMICQCSKPHKLEDCDR
jgi:hypothetical protein